MREESSLMMVAGRERALGDREFVCRVDRVCLNTRSLLLCETIESKRVSILPRPRCTATAQLSLGSWHLPLQFIILSELPAVATVLW